MIYTVTFNPSLDYVVDVKDFKLGIVNRTVQETIFPGGKGINVSMVLKNLGYNSTALGFTAGFVGNEIIRLLNEKGVDTDFIPVEKGVSRINVKLRSNEESEINGQGPKIEEADIKKFAMSRCTKKYVLCDSSKFNKISKATFAMPDEVTVITEKIPDNFRGYKIKEADEL